MEPPLKPSADDCCNSGCNPCILDIYEEQLQKYNGKISEAINVPSRKNCISPTTYTIFKLIRIVQRTHDTYLYTFQYLKRYNDATAINSAELALIYEPGQHFLLKGDSIHDESDHFTKAYTPIPINNSPATPLTFTVIAKHYQNGQMSGFFKKLQLGSETLWRGPYGSFDISFKFRFILLIAQGTGIAPLFAVIHKMVHNQDCETFLKLFFCCRTVHDILLRNELYELSGFWNFTYEIFLSSADEVKSKYSETIHCMHLNSNVIGGYVEDKIDRDLQVLVCGSEKFNNDMLQEVTGCGVHANNVFLF